MLQKMKYALLLTLLLGYSQTLHAIGCSEIFGNIAFDVEWIYFRPSIDHNLITRTTEGAIAVTNETIQVVPSYHSGWRLGALYQFCDGADRIGVRWTQLHTEKTKNFTGSDFNTPAGGIGGGLINVRDKFEFDYHAFEALYALSLVRGCGYSVDFLAGLEYANAGIKEKIDLISTREAFFIKEAGHFWGVGPELGVHFKVCLYNGFSIVGDGTGALLVSRVHERVKGTNPGAISTLVVNPFWRVVPTWDFRMGLHYEYAFNCLNLFLEGGYEVISNVRCLKLLNSSVQTLNFDFSNADLHGPYLALGVLF